jgi:hypothetical protein
MMRDWKSGENSPIIKPVFVPAKKKEDEMKKAKFIKPQVVGTSSVHPC